MNAETIAMTVRVLLDIQMKTQKRPRAQKRQRNVRVKKDWDIEAGQKAKQNITPLV